MSDRTFMILWAVSLLLLELVMAVGLLKLQLSHDAVLISHTIMIAAILIASFLIRK